MVDLEQGAEEQQASQNHFGKTFFVEPIFDFEFNFGKKEDSETKNLRMNKSVYLKVNF